LPAGETIDCDSDRTLATVASSINFEALDQAKINRKMSITGGRVAQSMAFSPQEYITNEEDETIRNDSVVIRNLVPTSAVNIQLPKNNF